MRLEQKIEYISSKLEELYPNPEIPLDHENNFTFLVAVMLSAQSTDKKVNEITPRLFSKANNPKKMSNLSVNEIQHIIREIGLATVEKVKNSILTKNFFVNNKNNVWMSHADEVTNLPKNFKVIAKRRSS